MYSLQFTRYQYTGCPWKLVEAWVTLLLFELERRLRGKNSDKLGEYAEKTTCCRPVFVFVVTNSRGKRFEHCCTNFLQGT